MEGLRELKKRYRMLGEVRGLGLMVAVDVLADDGQTLDHDRRDTIVQAAFHQGLLLLGCGEAAIRFCPPLCITAEQIATALRILDSVLFGSRKTEVVRVGG
jgi:4-aminobutyrate aminotransferase